MDIEEAEYETILGCMNIIKKCNPILAVSVYLALHQKRGGYKKRNGIAGRNMLCLWEHEFRPKKEIPMYVILSGLAERQITKLLSDNPVVFKTSWNSKRQCPHCDCSS